MSGTCYTAEYRTITTTISGLFMRNKEYVERVCNTQYNTETYQSVCACVCTRTYNIRYMLLKRKDVIKNISINARTILHYDLYTAIADTTYYAA